MGKTWNEKLAGGQPPHISVLEKAFAGFKRGATLFVPSPLLVRNYMLAIPYGQVRTITQMREEMAAQYSAQATCPLTASLFARIAAEAACDDMKAGKRKDEVAPFWRLIAADSAVGRRLSCGGGFINAARAEEKVLAGAAGQGSGAEVSACTT